MCGNSLSALGDSKSVVVDDDAKKNKKMSAGQQRAEGLTLSKPFPFPPFTFCRYSTFHQVNYGSNLIQEGSIQYA